MTLSAAISRLFALACLLAIASLAQAAPAAVMLTDAELLLRIRQAINDDMQRSNVLELRARQLQREYEAASAVFAGVDAELRAAQPDADGHTRSAALAATGTAVPPVLEQQWRRSRDLLDLLLQRRQSLEQQLELLRAKLQALEQAAQLIVVGQAPPEPGTADADAGPDPPLPADADAPAPPARRLSLVPIDGAEPGVELVAAAQPEVYDSRVAFAERERARSEQALRTAEDRLRLAEQLLSLNREEAALVTAALALTAGHAALLREEASLLRRAGIEVTTAAVQALLQRAERAEASAGDDRERVQALDARIALLDGIRNRAADALDAAELEHDRARRRLEFAQSPFAPHRLLNWAVRAVPRILVVFGVLAALWLLGRWLARRLVDAAVHRIRRSADEERVQRVETLRRALRSAITVVLALLGALIVLPEFGVDATVLMGSAAVLSLAIAFGAQSLIKDYFSGFMILSENQYRIGNVVRINDTSGVVEDISLRMTMLRDAEGVAHFIPHSEIRTVSNLTHGWAQALIDVRVGYREDVDRVMRVLDQLAIELRRDAAFGPQIMADPELWGVEELTESAVVVRMVLRTRPLKQWQVKRELLRRIKNRFDELGIEMPARQLSVRMDRGGAGAVG